eukprot:scaffold107934_cov40-Tisochrysis_lutea.AAC.2
MGIATSRVLLLALVGAEALRMPSASVSRRAGALRAMAGNEDPLANPMLGFINSFQEAIQTSPAAKFKAGLAKLQAGEYDVDAAKQLLNERGAKYTVIELNEVQGGYATRAELAELTGRTSVPAIFVGGQFIGGCNDGGMGGIVTLDKAGKLDSLLAEAGALA